MNYDEVNHAVNLLVPGASFKRAVTGHLYLTQPKCPYYPLLRWRLSKNKNWPYDRNSRQFSGGTVVQAMVQLSLWLMDKPRRPLTYWEYITSPNVMAASSLERGKELCGHLKSSTYVAKTNCVMCGKENPGDWWSLDSVYGPCCRWGRCNKGESA